MLWRLCKYLISTAIGQIDILKKKYRMLTCWRVAWMQMVTSRGVWFENTINRTIVISAFWILSAGICWNLCGVVIFNHSQLTLYIFLLLKKYIFLPNIGRYNYMFYYKKNIHLWNVRCQSFHFSCFKKIKINCKKNTQLRYYTCIWLAWINWT